jgi:F-type H+-transporting ATPase subunit delta
MAAVAADAQMVDCIGNPRLLPAQVAQLFLDVVGSVSAEQQNFVRLLVDNERLQVLPEIRDLYVELKNGQEGVQEADIASAFPLDDATLKNLVAELEAASSARSRRRSASTPSSSAGCGSPSAIRSSTLPCAASSLPWPRRYRAKN